MVGSDDDAVFGQLEDIPALDVPHYIIQTQAVVQGVEVRDLWGVPGPQMEVPALNLTDEADEVGQIVLHNAVIHVEANHVIVLEQARLAAVSPEVLFNFGGHCVQVLRVERTIRNTLNWDGLLFIHQLPTKY